MIYNNVIKKYDDGKSYLYDIMLRRLKYGIIKSMIFQVKKDREIFEMRCDCKNFEIEGIMCSYLF